METKSARLTILIDPVTKEAFERVSRVWPRYKGLPLGGMVDAIGKGPMAEVAQAIEAKSAPADFQRLENTGTFSNACRSLNAASTFV